MSAAIGNYTLQRIVFTTAIVLHTGPRIIYLLAYQQYYREVLKRNSQYLATTAAVLNVVEIVSLLGLTLVPSAVNYRTYHLIYTSPTSLPRRIHQFHSINIEHGYIHSTWMGDLRGFHVRFAYRPTFQFRLESITYICSNESTPKETSTLTTCVL